MSAVSDTISNVTNSAKDLKLQLASYVSQANSTTLIHII